MGYTRFHRRLEILSILVFLFLSLWHSIKLSKTADAQNFWIIALACLMSPFAADFASGLVHWAADTWGTEDWPIVGQSLIRSFREHHVDQELITLHDFVETNGNNCLASIPILTALFLIPVHRQLPFALFIFALVLNLTNWIFLTNQFHKWSHQKNINSTIGYLQRMHFILPKGHHSFHHQRPHIDNYCITNGWMNPILNKIKFFRRLESLITAVTGAVPREGEP